MTFFGRMSLTNVPAAIAARNGALLQLGHGALPPRGRGSTGTLAGVGIILVQYAFCRIWLRRHSHGPVEWLWKKLTWLDIPFFRPKNRLLRAIFSCPGLEPSRFFCIFIVG